MITPLNIPQRSQRNPQWARQRLGTVDSTTIGGYGCLITCISMMNTGFDPNHPLEPNQIDDLFTDNGGYANGNLVIWNAINRLLPNCATTGAVYCALSPAPIQEIKSRLDNGQLAVLQVGFGGNAKLMHYLLAVGYDGDDIIFNDPWYGDQSRFASKRYGTGIAERDILAVHYFADGVAEPVKPDVPVAKLPVEHPLLGYQRVIISTANANARSEPRLADNVVKKFDAGLTLDFKGFVHGMDIEGNDIWFVGRYSDVYVYSGCFTDTGTHDLPDLTPAPIQPEPLPEPPAPQAPAPEPQIEETSPPVDEPVEAVDNPVESQIPQCEESWIEDQTIPQKVVVNEDGAAVHNFETQEVVKTLPKGEMIQPLGGYFRVNGVQYVRTQSAVDNGWWNGIAVSDLEDYQPGSPVLPEPEEEVEETPAPSQPIINPGAPVDSIQPPATSDNMFEDDEPNESWGDEPRLPLDDVLKSLSHALLGLILSPLRLIGVVRNLLKGVK